MQVKWIFVCLCLTKTLMSDKSENFLWHAPLGWIGLVCMCRRVWGGVRRGSRAVWVRAPSILATWQTARNPGSSPSPPHPPLPESLFKTKDWLQSKLELRRKSGVWGNKIKKFARCVSRAHFAKIHLGQIHFGNRSLKAVGHSFREIYDIPWSKGRSVTVQRHRQCRNLKVRYFWVIWVKNNREEAAVDISQICPPAPARPPCCDRRGVFFTRTRRGNEPENQNINAPRRSWKGFVHCSQEGGWVVKTLFVFLIF